MQITGPREKSAVGQVRGFCYAFAPALACGISLLSQPRRGPDSWLMHEVILFLVTRIRNQGARGAESETKNSDYKAEETFPKLEF